MSSSASERPSANSTWPRESLFKHTSWTNNLSICRLADDDPFRKLALDFRTCPGFGQTFSDFSSAINWAGRKTLFMLQMVNAGKGISQTGVCEDSKLTKMGVECHFSTIC